MRPSISLENHRDQVREVLQRFRMANPRIFGSAARGEDTEQSDLDILVDAPNGTSLYDLAGVELELEAILGCKVEVSPRAFWRRTSRNGLNQISCRSHEQTIRRRMAGGRHFMGRTARRPPRRQASAAPRWSAAAGKVRPQVLLQVIEIAYTDFARWGAN
jgi:uncharacterized protein